MSFPVSPSFPLLEKKIFFPLFGRKKTCSSLDFKSSLDKSSFGVEIIFPIEGSIFMYL